MGIIFQNILLNICVLVLIAYLITRLPMVQKFIGAEHHSWANKIGMGALFGSIGIFSTYIGLPVGNAIANTRVIAVITAGVLGGPFVGLFAGVTAGLHRFAIDIGGFTAVACACSTVVEGVLGGLFSKRILKSKHQMVKLGLLTIVAECIQMAIILLVARPYDRAVELVTMISLPMISFNSLGAAFFIGMFDSIFVEQDRQAAKRVQLALDIANQCLPHFKKGLYSIDDMTQAAEIILQEASLVAVVITDRQQVIGSAGQLIGGLREEVELPDVVCRCIDMGKIQMTGSGDTEEDLNKVLRKNVALSAPLILRDEVVGCLVIFLPKAKLYLDVEYRFLKGLAQLLSTQLELSQLEQQKKLRRRAELAALQSQINPHFLFNSLSTISMFCREQPERARELLLELGHYFRNTLHTGDEMVSLRQEMQHVHAYLELEKARFGSKLQIEEPVLPEEDCMVPPFILQPLVENAIKHGAMKEGNSCKIAIEVNRQDDETGIVIIDNGAGISGETIEKLYNDAIGPESVGLSNVHKRLKNIYGQEYGLEFDNKAGANAIFLRIPKSASNLAV